VQISKRLFSGFISALEFVFVAVRIVLNVLELRKKDEITAEMKPHSVPCRWRHKKKLKHDLIMRTPYSLVFWC
jgi:hypothetical protein